MKKIAVIGNFGESGQPIADGQTIKTRILTSELQNQYGSDEVVVFNTYGGTINILKAPIYSFLALWRAKNVLILPAHNGVRVFPLLLVMLSMFFRRRRLHYSVIGGWLPQMITTKPLLRYLLKQFDGIYVETQTMKRALKSLGLENIYLLPNFKPLNIVDIDSSDSVCNIPYRLCTFSRVSKEKGIVDAINIVDKINRTQGKTIYTLDIYGQIDADQEELFKSIFTTVPEYVQYKGVADFNKSVEVLKPYFALLFPTHYYTEGIPGTIIDAYSAGVPVISAKWESFADIVDDNKTGLGYEFDDVRQLESILVSIIDNPQKLERLKEECIKKAQQYQPHIAIQPLLNNLIDN